MSTDDNFDIESICIDILRKKSFKILHPDCIRAVKADDRQDQPIRVIFCS